LKTPTYKKLNRVLASIDFKLKYPKVTVPSLTREISDYTLLLLDDGQIAQRNKTDLFKFELS
jgi:hypothetical protein